MPFAPGDPESIDTRNSEVDGQGITIDSSEANKNKIQFFTGSENSSPPYDAGAIPVPPAAIEVTQVTGGYADMQFRGPSNYDASRQATIRMGANIATMHANNNTTMDFAADQIMVGTGSLPVPSGTYPQVRIASSNLTVIKGNTATVVSGRLEDHDRNNVGYLGTRFGAHKKWQRIAAGALNPFWSANSRHGLPVGNWASEVFWDGGPLVHLQAFYDTGAQGFANGIWAFTPQDIMYQVDGGTEQQRLTLPTSPSIGGRPIAGSALLSNGTNYATRVGIRQLRDAGIANNAECWVFDYNDAASLATNTLPFAFGRLIVSLSATLPII